MARSLGRGVPNYFGTMYWFHEDKFSMDQGRGVVLG